MTAKEMFEELGYRLDRSQYTLDYHKYDKTKWSLTTHICFDLKNKKYSGVFVFQQVDIDMPTHRAIQKQIEELGWLE